MRGVQRSKEIRLCDRATTCSSHGPTLRRPTRATKPLLMAATEREAPQAWQRRMSCGGGRQRWHQRGGRSNRTSRFSLCSSVSADLHMLQMT
jgi:hypothetical protein